MAIKNNKMTGNKYKIYKINCFFINIFSLSKIREKYLL